MMITITITRWNPRSFSVYVSGYNWDRLREEHLNKKREEEKGGLYIVDEDPSQNTYDTPWGEMKGYNVIGPGGNRIIHNSITGTGFSINLNNHSEDTDDENDIFNLDEENEEKNNEDDR